MKKPVLFCMFYMLCMAAFSQQSYLQKVPPLPGTVSSDAVGAFMEQLTALKEEIDGQVQKFETENQAAASNIDPAAVVAAYTQVNAGDIAKMQKKTEEMMANQEKLTRMLEKYQRYSDSLRAAFHNDLQPYLARHKAYMDRCTGEGGDAAACKGMRSELAKAGKAVLLKYWFDETTAAYRQYLLSIRENVQPLHVLCSVQALESSEVSAGIRYPHKQDLGYLKFTLDYIAFIRDAWSIDSRLWPL